VVGDLSYSKAERTNNWRAVRFEVYPASMTYDWRAGVKSVTTSDPTKLSLRSRPAIAAAQNDGPEHLNDELVAGALDFTRDLRTRTFKSLQFGARASDRVKDHTSFASRPAATLATCLSQVVTYKTWCTCFQSVMLIAYKLGDGANVPALLTGDLDALADYIYGPNAFAASNATEELAERWSVNEKVYEGYGKLNFAADSVGGAWLTGNVGARVVHTETSSDGMQQDTASAFKAVTVDNSYTDLLPSANAKLDFGDGKVVRLGLAKVIARPPLDELRASRTLANWAPWTGSAGNPKLKPFKAVQLDASAEWYFRPESP
jgi:iron complex outermembrane receptor protein